MAFRPSHYQIDEEEPPPPYSETDFLDDYYFEEPAPVRPPLPPRCDSQTPPIQSGSSQFKVPRKPLRSYKSSPEVNLWAQNHGHRDGRPNERMGQEWPIHNGRQMAPIHSSREYQRQGYNNAMIVPPLPPRPKIYRKEVVQVRTREIQQHSQFQNQPSDDMFRRNTEKLGMEEQVYENVDASAETLVLSPTASSTSVVSSFSKLSVKTLVNRAQTLPITAGTDGSSPGTPNTKEVNFASRAFKQTADRIDNFVPHPVESNKHFSVIQHSSGIVRYNGTKTELAISIFAAKPLPENRTIWLQMRGWSGEAGMKAKAFFGSNGNWLEVTPNLRLEASSLSPQKEDKYQKSIAKFRKRSLGKERQKHILRETAIIRIPAVVEDGYYQFVICAGEKKKVLCTSPTFRFFSLSMNAHCLRGASLLSMPLEVGTMAVQTSIKTAAGTAYAAIAVTEKLQKVTTNKKVKAVMSSVTKMAESRAAKTSLAVMEKGAAMAAEAAGDTTAMVLGESVIVVGGVEISLQNGPGKLYPIHLTARTQTPYILQPEEYPDPQFAMTLSDVSNFAPNIIGSYFGWARFSPPKKSEESVDSTWQSIILHALPPTSAQLQRATISSANKLFFSLQLLSEIDTSIPPLSSVEIELMGYLRAPPPVSYGAAPIPIPGAIPELNYVDFDDRAMAMMVLDEMAWSPEAAAALRRGEKLQGFAKFVGGVSDVKGVALGQLGKVSLSSVGIRSPGDEEKEKGMFVSGFFVVR